MSYYPLLRKIYGFLFIAIFYGVLFSMTEKGQTQEYYGVSEESESFNPTRKNISLDLIPLEGCHCNQQKCCQMDSRVLCLNPGKMLIIKLNKTTLLRDLSLADQEENEIQSRCITDDWGGWLNWIQGKKPLEFIHESCSKEENIYYYRTTQALGHVRLSFISSTNPRYYADLRITVTEKSEE